MSTAKKMEVRPGETLLRDKVAQLRTAQDILKKNEQIQDALERSAISPKTAEQMSQCVKTPLNVARLELAYRRMLAGAGKMVAVPRSELLRTIIGLPVEVGPGDGEKVRGLIGGAKE